MVFPVTTSSGIYKSAASFRIKADMTLTAGLQKWNVYFLIEARKQFLDRVMLSSTLPVI